jgi:hypothetical protein
MRAVLNLVGGLPMLAIMLVVMCWGCAAGL